jgi:hypothetical protein
MRRKSSLTHSSLTPTNMKDTGMKETFNVFREESDGSFRFVGATDTLAQARKKVVQDPASFDREFVIVNAASGQKTRLAFGCSD